MIGLRVVDVGALVVWLVWFFRLRDDESDDGDDDGGGGSDTKRPEPGPPGPSIELPEDARPWSRRLRDGCSPRRAGRPARRQRQSHPRRAPVRPRTPVHH